MRTTIVRTALPRTVVVLGAVSLLNDAASEMIAPLLPVFLTTALGAGPAIVGLVEGVAEATASVLKLVAGRLADRGWRAKHLVLGGYATSNTARPLLGLALGWPAVLVLRFLDRVGKGIRTAPRDALIAGTTTPENRGRAFGFHRSMDHAGAVIGPLLAFWLLASGVPLADVFRWSIVPGVLVVALIVFGVPTDTPAARESPPPLAWRSLDAPLRRLVAAAAVLAAASIPEAFIVLWARDAGLPVAWLPLLWAAASLVKMLVVYPAGVASDRVGRLPMLVTGWSLRVALLLALAFVPARGALVWLLFVGYAATLAFTEPVERSLVGDRAAPALRGTAYGIYHLASGAFALPGAFAFGVLWERAGAAAALVAAALLTALAAATMAHAWWRARAH